MCPRLLSIQTEMGRRLVHVVECCRGRHAGFVVKALLGRTCVQIEQIACACCETWCSQIRSQLTSGATTPPPSEGMGVVVVDLVMLPPRWTAPRKRPS